MQEDELLEFLYQTPVGVIKTDLSGNILILNPKSTNLLMSINPNFDGNLPNLFELFSLYDKFFMQKIESRLHTNEKLIFENYDIDINKYNIKKLRIQSIKLASNNIAFVIDDISRLIELEENKKEIEKRLDAQQENLAKIGQAIRSVIHDLRNPIGNIQTISEMSEYTTPEELKDIFDTTIKTVLSEINSLMEDLLDYTKIETPKFDKIPIEVLAKHLKIKFDYFEKEFKVPFDFFYEKNIELICDEQKIVRIFTNISGNAAKALGKMKLSNPLIKIGINKEGKNIKFTIADNGTGIPLGLLEKLFDPFAFKSDYVGNGIGLSIVKNIVNMHKGSIDVVSNKDGTTFTILIPN